MKRTLAFAPETWGMGETRRMLAIAEAARTWFSPVFLDHGGTWSSEIGARGFPRQPLAPRVTPAEELRLLAVDQRRASGELWPAEVIEARVEAELEALEAMRPVAVVTGFCLTMAIGARLAGVPLVTVRRATGVRHYYRRGLGRLPDARDGPFLRVLPGRWLDRLASAHAARQKTFTRPFSRVARRRGLAPFATIWDLFEGDLTLIADVPETADLGDLPDDMVFVGPIDVRAAPRLDPASVPETWATPVVYCDLRGVARSDRIAGWHRALATVAGTLLVPRPGSEVPGPPPCARRHVATPLDGVTGAGVGAPAARCSQDRPGRGAPGGLGSDGFTGDVLRLCDAVVTHGDGSALLAVAMAGKPLVGVGATAEQEANLDCLVRQGMGLRIRRQRVDITVLVEALRRVLRDASFGHAAERYRDLLAGWNGPFLAAAELRARYDGEEAP